MRGRGTTCTKVASRKGQLYLEMDLAMCRDAVNKGRMVQNEPGETALGKHTRSRCISQGWLGSAAITHKSKISAFVK